MAQPKRVALVAGVTGLAGLNLAKKMLSTDKYGQWTVYGLSRRPSKYLPAEVNHVSCDLLDAATCKERLAPLGDVTHVFYTTWINKQREEDNIEANGTMLRNLLDNLPAKPQHVALLTGLKHYLGPIDTMAQTATILPTPYKESMGRLSTPNFYHTLEDLLFGRAKHDGYTWSVARPGFIVGFSPSNQINLGMTIAIYAAICKYSGKPFAFPGSQFGYNVALDITDAELLAEHLLWASTEPAAQNQAYNVANGDVFRFKQMWKVIADDFGLEVPDQVGSSFVGNEMESYWAEMVKKLELQPYKLDDVTTGILIVQTGSGDTLADVTKSREHGFRVYQNSEKSFLKLFEYLRQQKFIPAKSTL